MLSIGSPPKKTRMSDPPDAHDLCAVVERLPGRRELELDPGVGVDALAADAKHVRGDGPHAQQNGVDGLVLVDVPVVVDREEGTRSQCCPIRRKVEAP
jgi:hypothetical protein